MAARLRPAMKQSGGPWQSGKRCPPRGELQWFDRDFDAYFYPVVDGWLEAAYPDPSCGYCSARPVRPSGVGGGSSLMTLLEADEPTIEGDGFVMRPSSEAVVVEALLRIVPGLEEAMGADDPGFRDAPYLVTARALGQARAAVAESGGGPLPPVAVDFLDLVEAIVVQGYESRTSLVDLEVFEGLQPADRTDAQLIERFGPNTSLAYQRWCNRQ